MKDREWKKLKNLLYIHKYLIYFHVNIEYAITHTKNCIKTIKKSIEISPKSKGLNRHLSNLLLLVDLLERVDNPERYNKTVNEVYHLLSKKYNSNEHKPPKVDNRGYKHGSGGYNKNKIRFPKKKRKYHWKKFYKMFPEYQ